MCHQTVDLVEPADVAALGGFVEAAVAGGVDLFGRISGAGAAGGQTGLRDAG